MTMTKFQPGDRAWVIDVLMTPEAFEVEVLASSADGRVAVFPLHMPKARFWQHPWDVFTAEEVAEYRRDPARWWAARKLGDAERGLAASRKIAEAEARAAQEQIQREEQKVDRMRAALASGRDVDLLDAFGVNAEAARERARKGVPVAPPEAGAE